MFDNGINVVYGPGSYDTTWLDGIVYNPETHDLVEKKEAKVKRLEGDLKLCESRIECNKHSLEVLSKLLLELGKEKKEIKKELKGLEE